MVSVDRRIAPWEENDQVWRELRTMLQDTDTQVDAPFLSVPSLETNCKEPVCRALEQVCNSLVPTRGKFICAHYCSNASTIAATGVPAVVFGPGSIEQAHTDAEYIDLTELEAASEIYYQLMANASSLETTSPPLDPTSETRQ